MKLGRSAGRALLLGSRLVRHPTWAVAHVEGIVRDRAARRVEPLPRSTPLLTVEEALARLTSAPEDAVAAALATVPSPRLAVATPLVHSPDGSDELVALAYGLCRLLRPEVVLETGVAHGYSSAAVLAALDDNGGGRLLSIDLPHLAPGIEQLVGAAVEPRLRPRWRLMLGPAERLLPRVLREIAAVDVFLQDAAHSVSGQLAEYRRVWPSLRPGGILVSDDATAALELFAAETGAEPVYVDQAPKLPIGALVKAGA